MFSIQEKINDTKYAMDWINSRIKTNNEKIEKLAGQRCESNSLFIETLREKQEALEVLAWLKKDLEELKAKGVLFLEEDEIKDFTTKLNGYSKIYEQKALKDFEKLAKNDENHFSLIETEGILFILKIKIYS